MHKEEKDEVPNEELDERPEDEPLMDDPEKEVTELTKEITASTDTQDNEDTVEITVEPETEEKAEDEPVVDEPEPWPPFKVMPGSKKVEGPTVRERVPQLRDKVFKLYKRMKRGERLTEKQFAKRLKLTDPKDIQAAGIAWHFMRDEGKITGEQFYKPLTKD